MFGVFKFEIVEIISMTKYQDIQQQLEKEGVPLEALESKYNLSMGQGDLMGASGKSSGSLDPLKEY